MAFESGIDERDLAKSMLPRLAPQVYYLDSWVCFRNWEKYHDNGSEQTKKGIENAWKAVPTEIRLRLKEMLKNGTPPIDPLDGASSFTSSSSSSFTSTSTSLTSVASKDAEPVNKFIGLFKEVNPSYEQLFKNKAQRGAATRLLKKFGLDSMAQTLSIIEKTNGMPYAPVITTPLELEKFGGKLKAFVTKNKQESLKNKIVSV
jgi:hypothetical protein